MFLCLTRPQTSACGHLPVITLSTWELAPFSAFDTSSLSCQASDPYVTSLQSLQTLDLYSGSRRFLHGGRLSAQICICLILPKRYLTDTILIYTSVIHTTATSYKHGAHMDSDPTGPRTLTPPLDIHRAAIDARSYSVNLVPVSSYSNSLHYPAFTEIEIHNKLSWNLEPILPCFICHH